MKMSVLKLFAILLISILGVTEGLKCYKCSSCEEGEVGEAEQCAEGFNVCLKMSIAGIVHKSCSKEAACSIADTEDVLKDAWADIKDNFQTEDQERNMTSQEPDSQDCNIKCNWPNEPLYGVHATDCVKYIQCTASGPVVQTCQPGTRWDQNIMTCSHVDTTPCVAGCNKRDVPEPRTDDIEKYANCCSEDYCNGADNKVAVIYTLIPILSLPILNYFL